MEQQRNESRDDEDFQYPRRLNAFGKWVSRQVRTLVEGGYDATGVRHGGYLQNESYAVSAVARLRRSVGHEVGADPDIFIWTMPPSEHPEIAGDVSRYPQGPSPEERAAHAAITLFAVHQQSNRAVSMHTDSNVSFGRAVGRMACGNFNEDGIRSMFDRLQTASSWKELVRHARSLISLLKRERIAINYGLFAQDLLSLRGSRNQANAVRTLWGRDFQSAYRHEQMERDKDDSER
ncbi:type I-E CRISPR-associated protein Cse2/CasB [Bifidobacterium callimiconis]|uniref:type I-E CRISPR-associated protein Cse2/CasB n=1 Tax=Bifidobacterium callimiconis TaxID=2306973 RepID=UPI001BDCFABE|nr:type I-E CRISPR-associated protein Cse2/CasB [Bifidobacterium callimiconis]MBT1176069.1 type I-E CRISPR-associated protein Cse2/CasB [Bifidobacterium callimiconis]